MKVLIINTHVLCEDGSSGNGMRGYGLDQTGLGWGQVAGILNAVMNLRVP